MSSAGRHFPVIDRLLLHPMISVKADAPDSTMARLDQADERELVHRLRRGERAALGEIVSLHHERIVRLVGRLNGWPNDTDDLVQEVFLSAMRHAGRFRGQSQLSTWLTRIAINVCRQHRRTRLFRATFWRRWINQAASPIAEDAAGPSILGERAAKVTEAVRRLSQKYREVIVLHYLEGVEIEQIAALLGLTRSTVQVRLHRGRAMLREMLQSLVEPDTNDAT